MKIAFFEKTQRIMYTRNAPIYSEKMYPLSQNKSDEHTINSSSTFFSLRKVFYCKFVNGMIRCRPHHFNSTRSITDGKLSVHARCIVSFGEPQQMNLLRTKPRNTSKRTSKRTTNRQFETIAFHELIVWFPDRLTNRHEIDMKLTCSPAPKIHFHRIRWIKHSVK